LPNVSKLLDNTSTVSGRGSQSYNTSSTSSASRSKGKSHRSVKGSINTMPIHHHRTIISLHDLRHSTTSYTINHHHRHIINSTDHLHHLRHSSALHTPRVQSPATYNSHHAPQITEPHLCPNIMETPILTNFSCATKLP
jgi:hypothetical protein